MDTITIESTAVWVHVSSGANGMARWTRGAARKGNRDGKTNLSAVLFPLSEITAAVNGKHLIGAELVFRRDAAYGTAAVGVCAAPAQIDTIGEVYMSRDQCLALAVRNLHKCHTVSGDTAVFSIPGATLREMAAGNVNAFLLYQESDGTGAYLRMSDTARLLMYVAADGDRTAWMTPVWTRTVSAGDVISDAVRSHVADLNEILWYVNIRRRLNGLTELPDMEFGAFADWADQIGALQAGEDGFLEAEGRLQPGDHYDWIEPDAEDMPQAAAVEQLKTVLRGGDETQANSRGFTAMQILYSLTENYDTTRQMTWETPETVKAGKLRSQRTGYTPDGARTVTLWETYACGWLFGAVPEEATVGDVEIAVKASDVQQPRITLYGLIAADVPGTAAYQAVFGGTVIGEGDCPVGEATRIRLTAQGLNAIRAGTLTGAGIRYDNQYVEIAGGAALITDAPGGEDE